MENINSADDLFLNIRKSIRLLYEYQKRMQGTMFHIKSVLNLSPGDRIEVNKLFSRAPRESKDYGETQLSSKNWAWDYIYPMAMEYYIGERKLKDKVFALSIIQVTDDGYYQALKQNLTARRVDTYTFCSPEESDSMAVFIMEIKDTESSWASRWKRDTMEDNLNRWMVDESNIINDITESGNHFVVMKFPIQELLTEISISKVLEKVNSHIQDLTGLSII